MPSRGLLQSGLVLLAMHDVIGFTPGAPLVPGLRGPRARCLSCGPVTGARQRPSTPAMMFTSGDGAVFLADEIFAQVAAGGIGIIFSGIIGAFLVGKIANIEGLEADLLDGKTYV